MALVIKFEEGRLASKSYPLGSAPVLIGRSRECGIVIPKEHSRVSKRHVVLVESNGCVSITNLSNHENTTHVGDGVVPFQHKAPVSPGTLVRLGPDGEVAFRVVEEIDVTSERLGLQNKDVRTVDPAATMTRMQSMTMGTVAPGTRQTAFAAATAGAVTSGRVMKPNAADDDRRSETFASPLTDEPEQEALTRPLVTVFVNPDEIKKLIDESNRERRMRSTFRFAAVVVGLCTIAALYYFMRPRPEQILTWPRNANGDFAVREIVVPVPLPVQNGGGGFFIKVPDDSSLTSSVSTNKDGTISLNVLTHIGSARDVPFFVETTSGMDVSFATNSLKTLFESYKMKCEASGSWNFLASRPVAFLGEDNGLPYFEAKYLRTLNSESSAEQRFGHLLFVAYGDVTIVVSREIPAIEQWRGGVLLANEPILSVTAPVLEVRWDGMEDYRKASVADLLAEADGSLSRKAPKDWKDIEFLLQSAMINSTLAGLDPHEIHVRFRDLRVKERMEFRRLYAEWEKFCRLHDKAASDATVDEALKIFPNQFDKRHWLLQKGVWK